jgi:hypothetical protein
MSEFQFAIVDPTAAASWLQKVARAEDVTIREHNSAAWSYAQAADSIAATSRLPADAAQARLLAASHQWPSTVFTDNAGPRQVPIFGLGQAPSVWPAGARGAEMQRAWHALLYLLQRMAEGARYAAPSTPPAGNINLATYSAGPGPIVVGIANVAPILAGDAIFPEPRAGQTARLIAEPPDVIAYATQQIAAARAQVGAETQAQAIAAQMQRTADASVSRARRNGGIAAGLALALAWFAGR